MTEIYLHFTMRVFTYEREEGPVDPLRLALHELDGHRPQLVVRLEVVGDRVDLGVLCRNTKHA